MENTFQYLRKHHWITRMLILVVLCWNIQCALVFMIDPASYMSGFQLSGVPGMTVVRSTGLLFLMWNIPYLFAFLRPHRWNICLWVAIIQQGIALLGETWIMINAVGEFAIQSTIQKFIYFDAAGLILLIAGQAVLLASLKKG